MRLIGCHPWSFGADRAIQRARRDSWSPDIDVEEEEDRFVIRADVPGLDPKDIEVVMHNGTLSIQGERRIERHETSGEHNWVERSGGKFLRRFALPDSVDPDAITAQSTHGVLEVVIPKRPDSRSHRIKVQAS